MTKLLIDLLRIPNFNYKTYEIDYLFNLWDIFVIGHGICSLYKFNMSEFISLRLINLSLYKSSDFSG